MSGGARAIGLAAVGIATLVIAAVVNRPSERQTESVLASPSPATDAAVL